MNKSILICDDDAGILDVTTMILQDKGYHVTALHNCHDIMAKIEKLKPAVILLDLWMPDVNGEEVTRALKNNKKTKDIPVIIISASKDTKKVAENAGANDFICKPFDIEDLETKVDKYAQGN